MPPADARDETARRLAPGLHWAVLDDGSRYATGPLLVRVEIDRTDVRATVLHGADGMSFGFRSPSPDMASRVVLVELPVGVGDARSEMRVTWLGRCRPPRCSPAPGDALPARLRLRP